MTSGALLVALGELLEVATALSDSLGVALGAMAAAMVLEDELLGLDEALSVTFVAPESVTESLSVFLLSLSGFGGKSCATSG